MELNWDVQKGINEILLGERIGSGAGRLVYENDLDPDNQVVKLETAEYSYQNILEWETWQTVENTNWGLWFAPCLHLSKNAKVLIQAKTSPLIHPPKKIPNFFTDLKVQNFGIYKGRVVAHDYGLNLLMDKGLTRGSLVKAEWWHEDDR